MKYLFAGILIVASVSVISIPLGIVELWFNVVGVIGTVLFVIAGILSGSFVSGDRIRANNSCSLGNENRALAMKLIMAGLPGFVAAIIYYIYK